MDTLEIIIGLLGSLRGADLALQTEIDRFFSRYYAFLRSSSRSSSRGLRLRRYRDACGHVRSILWARRLWVKKVINNRSQILVRELPGPFRASWIYHYARDWSRREGYFAFEKERRRLIGARQGFARARRALRLALLYKFSPRATPEDLEHARRLVEAHPADLASGDLRPLVGGLVLARELTRAEERLRGVVEEYRRAFPASPQCDVGFQPMLRRRPGGSLRLSWGFPQMVSIRSGRRGFTEYLRGWPTDCWMRTQRLRAAVRKAVGVFIRQLRAVDAEYRLSIGFLGYHRRQIGGALRRARDVGESVPEGRSLGVGFL